MVFDVVFFKLCCLKCVFTSLNRLQGFTEKKCAQCLNNEKHTCMFLAAKAGLLVYSVSRFQHITEPDQYISLPQIFL